MISLNPATETILKEFKKLSDDEVEVKLTQAEQVFSHWRTLTVTDRKQPFYKLINLLRERVDSYGLMISQEMGKLKREAQAEVEKCAMCAEYYLDVCEQALADVTVEDPLGSSFIAYKPLGPLLAIMPWNFPFWQVFRFAIPSLLAGNVVVLKHASNVPLCALAIEQVFLDAGFPAHVFQSLLIGSEQVEPLIADARIRGVTLTGSTQAGRKVASLAGFHLKKTVLELGGNDPYLILMDADLDRAVALCVTSRFLNAGQSCIAAKRFIVDQSVYQSFVEKMTQAIAVLQYGDPLDDATQLAPLATLKIRQELQVQVEASIQKGARCILGGSVPTGVGYFYPATLLVDVKPGMPAFDEELFGPVAAIIMAQNEDHAIELANQSQYGLGAAIMSRDQTHAKTLARDKIEAGSCFVNDFVKSDPKVPFGGIKDSGYGRELSVIGLHEFTNIKTVVIR